MRHILVIGSPGSVRGQILSALILARSAMCRDTIIENVHDIISIENFEAPRPVRRLMLEDFAFKMKEMNKTVEYVELRKERPSWPKPWHNKPINKGRV